MFLEEKSKLAIKTSTKRRPRNIMKKSPAAIQQWVDTLPSSSTPAINIYSTPPRRFLPREVSLQSDDGSSHCSSVESVLELRKPDPEAVLLELGFGPPKNSNIISRIPSRFLQPSKLLTQVDIEKFLEQYGEKYPEQNSAPNSPARQRPKTS